MTLCILSILLCLVGLSMGQPSPTENYPHETVLDTGSQVRLYWKFNSTFITFELHGKTTGWIGMGISPSGGMIGADIYMAWVADGVVHITDRHGDLSRNTYPPLDTKQNVKLISGSESNGWTVIKFERQIAACTESGDITITTNTQRVIWALGQTDPAMGDVAHDDYHGSGLFDRGTKSLSLLERAPSQVSETLSTFDLLNDALHVPHTHTYCNLRLLELPALSSKQHVVKIEPIIEAGNEAIVHYMLVIECSHNAIMKKSNIDTDWKCEGLTSPFDVSSCFKVMYGWAIGGETFYFPNHVGLSLGTPGDPKYVILETHYDNPGRRSDIVDSSGFRFSYTSDVRKYDASVLEVGHFVSPLAHVVPPNAATFKQYGECNAECMMAAMEVEEQSNIKIFGSLLHTHLLGRKLTLRHFDSNGTELPFIAQDNNYDFNYQEVKVFQQEVVFNSGDSMMMVCDYDSSSRVNVTFGGYASSEEMCLAYVFYYPKIPLSRCESLPVPVHLYEAFGIESFEQKDPAASPLTLTLDDFVVEAPASLAGQTLAEVMNSIPWNQTSANALSESLQREMWNLVICQNTSAFDAEIPQYSPPPDTKYVYKPQNATSTANDVCTSTASVITPPPSSVSPLKVLHTIIAITIALVSIAVVS